MSWQRPYRARDARRPHTNGERPADRAGSSGFERGVHNHPACELQARVRFDGGITNIVQQAAAGTIARVHSSQPRVWFRISILTSASPGGDLVRTQVIVQGQLTSGTPITGTTSLPAGSTASASINNGAPQPIANGSSS